MCIRIVDKMYLEDMSVINQGKREQRKKEFNIRKSINLIHFTNILFKCCTMVLFTMVLVCEISVIQYI